MNRTFRPASQYAPNSTSHESPATLYENQYDNQFGYYHQAQSTRMNRSQYEDDYYDEPDILSSPTPPPRQTQSASRRALVGTSNHIGRQELNYPSFQPHERLEPSAGYEFSSYPNSQVHDNRPGYEANVFVQEEVPYHNVRLSQNDDSTRSSSYRQPRKLIPVSRLPDWCRGMFKFGVFNAMQSECFATAMNTSSNMVISAPTGAGKTVLFELAVIRLLQSGGDGLNSASKCVYMAPTKAICSERSRDWTNKFAPIGVKCCELTGDTMKSGKSAWREAKDCTIIITTPEKWDSLTRNWNDSSGFLQQINLFMVDEVHTVGETTRGSCLEVVVSRMMQRGNNVRFVLLSATAPNIEDIKDWLSSCSSGESTDMFKFGEEFRPCKLKRHVYGYARPQGFNDFQFMKTLDYKLFPLIQEHSCGKPILVFCPTRKGVMSTAVQLMEVCQAAINAGESLPWDPPGGLNVGFLDGQLESLAKLGLGVHHAGLSLDDRRTIEDLFTQRKLSVVVATSTLAVGVNFPAHAVIVKGVMQWAGNGWAEYSSQDIMQMLGRAGRPQFDREGVGIIMCEKILEAKYTTLASGGSHLESTLHHNLTEHINSEIGLNTIQSIDMAKQWLRKTFLFRRIQKNPTHYNVGIDTSEKATWEECMDALVTRSLTVLRNTKLVKSGDSENELLLTDFGEIMSYYIRHSTMKLFIETASANEACLRSVLLTLSGAEEFKDMHMRSGERQLARKVYNKLSEHESIRFPVKKAETPTDKAFLLIQAVLGGIPLMSSDFKSPNSQPHMEALNVMRHAPRMIAALVDTALATKNGAVIINAMSLMRSLNGKAWEDRPAVMKQLEGIGEKSFKARYYFGIRSVAQLDLGISLPGRIEMLLNRRAPFGSDIISIVRSLPTYTISVEKTSVVTNHAEGTIDIALSISVSAKIAPSSLARSSKNFDTRTSSVLTISSDNQLIDFRRINTKRLLDTTEFSVTASLTKPSQTIVVVIGPDKFAGVTERYDFKPNLPASAYPTLNTRPLKQSEYADQADAELGEDAYSDDILDLTNLDEGESRSPTPDTKIGKRKAAHTTTKGSARINKPRLPNGNYACREGLIKPPPSPKRAKLKAAGPFSPQPPFHATKNAMDKQRSQLNHLHSKVDDGASRIKNRSLARPRDPPPTKEATAQYMDSLLSSPIKPTTSKQDIGSLPTSDQELPEPPALLVGKKKSSVSSDSNSYDDSEMDQWAANIPSEILDVDEDESIFFPIAEHVRHAGQSSKSDIPIAPKGTKRRVNLVEEHTPHGRDAKRSKPLPVKINDSVVDLDTPVRNKPTVEALPTPLSASPPQREARKPLFRPTSSPIPPIAEPLDERVLSQTMQGITPPGDDLEKFLDDIFDGVMIVPTEQPSRIRMTKPLVPSLGSITTRSIPVDFKVPLAPTQQQPPAQQHRQTEYNSEEVHQIEDEDPMAELNAWLDDNGL
ncbi:P-loop containing nucleoside triphosphate hydrolase protein [Ceratobasidium sp. AG-I]|nr:P-loop containing nucleoside triphosphate hydrolase protein [Ceratobasidium sp. AG-I]